MASLRQIKSRMKSIENIHEITKAMGMIASFRFKKAENRFTRLRNYFLEIERMLGNLAASNDFYLGAHGREPMHPLFEPRKIKRKTLVVMTGDKGLCGAYNSNLLKEAMNWMAQNSAFETNLIPVGKVGNDLFRRKHHSVLLSYPEKAMADQSLSKKVTEDLMKAFLTGSTDSIEILYAAYRAGTPGRVTLVPYLGLSAMTEKAVDGKNPVDYIYEPDFSTVFLSLLSRYLEGKIYLTLLESLTSESSARMLAMKQATDNAEDVLDALKLLKNKTRQATITRELSEIVSGASVLV